MNTKEVLFVNVYLVDRAFGGPEEGGWYYDYGVIERVYPVMGMDNAERLKQWLEAEEFSNEGRRDISSVLSEGQYQITIDEKPGENWPKERPFYE